MYYSDFYSSDIGFVHTVCFIHESIGTLAMKELTRMYIHTRVILSEL